MYCLVDAANNPKPITNIICASCGLCMMCISKLSSLVHKQEKPSLKMISLLCSLD